MPLKAPIFILGCHKSGTSLLRSLLDGHPELYVLPIEMHWFRACGYWVDYPLRRNLPRQLDDRSLIESMIREVELQNRNTDPYADAQVTGALPVSEFAGLLRSSSFSGHAEFFAATVRALYRATMRQDLPSRLRIVEKSVENAEYACTLSRYFPDARFIHVVRNPYATLVAIRLSKTRGGFPSLERAVLSMRRSYHELFRNESAIPRYLTVRYEDLVTDTTTTLEQVCRFLELKWSDSALEPTSQGKPWCGNSTSNVLFSGVSTRPLNAFERTLTGLETALVNRHCAPVLQRFAYPWRAEGARWWWRIGKEGPRAYVRNRSCALFRV